MLHNECAQPETQTQQAKGTAGERSMRGGQWLNGIMHKCQAIYSAPLGAVHATLCSISAAHSHPHYDRQCQHELLNHLSICTSLRVFWYDPPSLPSLPTLSLDLLQQLQPSSLKESPTNDDEVIGAGRRGALALPFGITSCRRLVAHSRPCTVVECA